MIVHVANPIYDSVFKYLMEDERIAKTIPRSKLKEMLKAFQKFKADADDPHLLMLNSDEYADDENMQYLVHRLTAAASSPQMRRDMNVEDEYFSALENRDTKIMQLDKQVKEQGQQLKQQKKQIESIAKALLSKGMSVAEVAAITGRSEEEIRKMHL